MYIKTVNRYSAFSQSRNPKPHYKHITLTIFLKFKGIIKRRKGREKEELERERVENLST